MKPYNTDYIEADNSKYSAVLGDFSSQDIKLAKSIWFVELCRQLHMPNRLQLRILRCCGGSANLWSCSIKQIIARICAFSTRCQDCFYHNICMEPDNRETRFISNRDKDFYSMWADNAHRDQVLEQVRRYQNRNIFALDITDGLYPQSLINISGYPAVIFCEGDGMRYLRETPLRVTIVGTREPTPYGIKATEIITRVLAAYDCAIISGLAKGVDALVHKTTLENGGFTAAVTAGSTDIYYPYQNKLIQQEIAEKGVIISEHPPGTKPVKYFFPARNRILSGIADVVVVTESPKHSGTLITTSFATDQNREVYAVPGNIIQATSRGCNRLIIDGAALLDDPAQIIDRYGLQLRNKHNILPQDDQLKSHRSQPKNDNLTEQELMILACLTSYAMNMDQITSAVKMPVDKVASLVTGLELKNRIRRSKGQYFLTYE